MNIFTLSETITPTRTFNLLYIILDSIFVIVLLLLLFFKKRYTTILFAIFGGVLYFVVDYCGFYLLSGTRSIYINGELQGNLNTALVLLWMSLSYGITNFAFIWLCIKKDKYLKYWLLLIIGWWLTCPAISLLGGEYNIKTFRTTNAYHGYMAIVLVIGYLGLIVYDLFSKKKFNNILRLNIIGISVQFCWEFALLIHGIRPLNENSFQTIIVNSLIETNLGMPYIFLIYLFVIHFVNEDLTKVNNASEEVQNK